jgi:hypothetical protein
MSTKPPRISKANLKFNEERDSARQDYKERFRDNPDTPAPIDPLVLPLLDSLLDKSDFYSIASCQGHAPEEPQPGLSRRPWEGHLFLNLRDGWIQDQLALCNIPNLRIKRIRRRGIYFTWDYQDRNQVIPALQAFLSRFS